MNPSAASSVPVIDRYLLAAQLRWLAEREAA